MAAAAPGNPPPGSRRQITRFKEWSGAMKRSLVWLLLVAMLFSFSAGAFAADWPSRPIKLIVPTGAGHAVDVMARMVATGVSQGLGQTMFVENMPGAAGFIGAQATARATPDGDTFLFA